MKLLSYATNVLLFGLSMATNTTSLNNTSTSYTSTSIVSKSTSVSNTPAPVPTIPTGLTVQSIAPLDPALPVSHDTYGAPFENVNSSLPLMLGLFVLSFAVFYYGNRFYHHAMALREVNNYVALTKTPPQFGSNSYQNSIASSAPLSAGPPPAGGISGSVNSNTRTSIRAPATASDSPQNTTSAIPMSNNTQTSIRQSVLSPSTQNTMSGAGIRSAMNGVPPMPPTIQRTILNANTTMTFQNIQFQSAGIGFAGGNTTTVINDRPSPLQAANSPLGDTLVEYDAAVFSMPGFMQMDFTNDLKLKGKIAEGGGGVVYKGELNNHEFIARAGVKDVVVKVLKPLPHMAFAELKTTVFQEIAIMYALINHSNIITLVGFTEEPLSIVTKLYDRNLFSLCMALPEYASESAGLDALKNFMKADSKLKKGIIVKGFEMLPEIALHLAWGMASGMAEMHDKGILHRDLKSANVLLELKHLSGGGEKPPWMADARLENMSRKISGLMGQNSLAGGVGWGNDAAGRPYCPIVPIVCDFGLAKMIKQVGGENELGSTAVKGMHEAHAIGISYRYAAPEAFNRMYQKSGKSDEAKPVDVYAFAVMCWEMMERKVPFHKIPNKDLEQKVKAGERPIISLHHRNPQKPFEGNKHYTLLMRIIESCWKQDPRERPSFTECKLKLKNFWLGPPNN